jgi:translocation and assembly module TamA
MFVCFYGNTIYAQINISIEIQGVDSVLENNVRQFLTIEQQINHPLLSEGRLRYLHKKAEQEITKALQPYGYYRPQIKSELTQLAPQQWRASYNINPGLPIPIAEFSFILSDDLNNDPEFLSLIQTISLHKGAPFSHIKYENIKSSLVKLAADRGYFAAHFVEHRVEINLKTYDVRIYLNYDGGRRYRFGKVLLEQEVLEPELLNRYIPFKQGDPYSLSKVLDLQQALNDSDYFNRVEVSPGQPQIDSIEIPITVKLIPRKPNRYSLGLGYGTDTGARAKVGWDKPLLNTRGHRINSEAKVSEIGYSLGAQYRVPVLNPRTDQIIYSSGVVNEKTDTSDSTVSTVGASLNRSLGLWRQSIALNYQYEDFIVAGDEGLSKLLIPSISLSRTWGSGFIYTLDGLRFDISLRGASDKLLSDNSFTQLQGGIKAITSIGKYNRLITRGRLGSTWTDDFHQLPSSVRFFAGGTQSVRGYSYQSLGPVDSSGKVVGGRYLMIGSIEFEHNLSDKWGAALFYDAGNAYDQLEDKLERGAGFGIRWKSPIGPVRFDFASALSRPGQPWRLHINIGPDL